MWDKKLSIEEGTDNLQLQRQNNSFIMEDFIAAGMEVDILAELNRFGLFLHETCGSGISTDDGNDISLN